MKEFRTLYADEIDVRVGQFVKDYAVLLLYKDARCDMAILDETVGAMNWKKTYSRDNANCILSIWDEEKQQWVDKEDSGSAGDFERDKSLASDSFKRAAVAWGIGRELYTIPTILYFPTSSMKGYDIEKRVCYDKFIVTDIQYDDKKNIRQVQIRNEKTGDEYLYQKEGVKPLKQTSNDTSSVNAEQQKSPEVNGNEVDTTCSLPFNKAS